jgi:hypothetical protein
MYVNNGQIKSKRPEGVWRINWLLWTILNFFGFFFSSMFSLSNKPRRRSQPPPKPRRQSNIRSFKPGECQSKGG